MNPLKKSALFTTMLFVALLLAHSSRAGDIEGALSVAKLEPSQPSL